MTMHDSSNLFVQARAALMEAEPQTKCELAEQLYSDWNNGLLKMEAGSDLVRTDVTEPGRPQKPELVHPRALPRRGLGTQEGQAALIHAVTHIEFNAINLALDAVYRYPGMPAEYYGDWLRVAHEESRHFNLLRNRLNKMDYDYGDFAAHNGLWEIAMRTAHDLVHRMAMVPRMMEARGLDVTPDMIKRFRKIGDLETADILKIILSEEIGHVEAGSRWFRFLCKERGIDAEQTWLDLVQNYLATDIRCPLHWETRRQAGFSDNELEQLQELCTRN
jgi:uncharacterized ferritin-like protein (DUF455 family)